MVVFISIDTWTHFLYVYIELYLIQIFIQVIASSKYTNPYFS